MLELSADPDAAEASGHWHGGIFMGHIDIVKLLLEARANIELPDRGGAPLHFAACSRRLAW